MEEVQVQVEGELRMFTFGHFMLSSIQQGIQAAHAITTMFTVYQDIDDPMRDILYSWASQHETLVCKNGGNAESLQDIVDIFCTEDNYLPYSDFRESEEAMNEILTCVAIVVPERLYDEGVKVVYNRNAEYKFHHNKHHYLLDDVHYTYTEFEYNLIQMLRKCRHAQ